MLLSWWVSVSLLVVQKESPPEPEEEECGDDENAEMRCVCEVVVGDVLVVAPRDVTLMLMLMFVLTLHSVSCEWE
jgi:hypothetical protein